MKIALFSFLTFLFSMLIMDAVWLGLMVNRFYTDSSSNLDI